MSSCAASPVIPCAGKRWPRPMCPASGTAGADDAVEFAERSPGLLVGRSNAKPPKEVPNEEVPHEEVPHGVKCNVRNLEVSSATSLFCSRGRPTCKVWLEAMKRCEEELIDLEIS